MGNPLEQQSSPEKKVTPAENCDAQKDKLQTETQKAEQGVKVEVQEKIKADFEKNLKSFLDGLKSIPEEKKSEFYKKAGEENLSLIELQMGHKWLQAKPEEKYAKLSALYLTRESSRIKESFKVSDALDKNERVKMTIGAAHLLPPNVKKARITDKNGVSRIGTREIRDGRIGYFDANGYMPIFGGYEIEPLETLDPNSQEAKKQFEMEQKFSQQKIEEFEKAKKREQADDLPSTLDTLTSATKEILTIKGYKESQIDMILKGKESYQKATQIFARNSIKIDSDSAIQGARGFYGLDVASLGWQEGKSISEMQTEKNPTIQFLKTLQNGGTMQGIKIKGGYQLNYSQLPEFVFIAQQGERLKEILSGIQADMAAKGDSVNEISAGEIVKYIFERGTDALDANELRAMVEKNPNMRHMLDPKWGIENYMKDSWIRRGSAIKGIRRLTDADMNAGRDQEVVGSLCCAYSVSNFLNLREQGYGNELSASRLMCRLIKGGGKVLPSILDSERGDVIASKGTTDRVEKDQVGHVLLTRDVARMPSGGKIVIIQDSSRVLGIQFLCEKANDQKRLQRIVSNAKNRLNGDMSHIEDLFKQEGFSPSDAQKMTSAFAYRQKFPDTIRVSNANGKYFTTHLYAVVRPNYENDAQQPQAVEYAEANRPRLTSHA